MKILCKDSASRTKKQVSTGEYREKVHISSAAETLVPVASPRLQIGVRYMKHRHKPEDWIFDQINLAFFSACTTFVTKND